MLIHSVYFWLRPDLASEQRAEFRQQLQSLGAIGGVQRIAIGVPAAVAPRGTVDATFSFALILTFADLAAHDAYQVDPVHQAFGNRCRAWWARVQVYDTQC